MKKGGLGQHIRDQLGGFTHVTYLDPKEKGLVWDILMIFFYHSSTYSECLILTPGHLMILMILFRAWTQPVKHWQLQVSGLHSRAYQESPIFSWRLISDLWISDHPPEEKLTSQPPRIIASHSKMELDMGTKNLRADVSNLPIVNYLLFSLSTHTGPTCHLEILVQVFWQPLVTEITGSC